MRRLALRYTKTAMTKLPQTVINYDPSIENPSSCEDCGEDSGGEPAGGPEPNNTDDCNIINSLGVNCGELLDFEQDYKN